MRQARVLVDGVGAGVLEELEDGSFRFCYAANYSGQPVSLTMPVLTREFSYKQFPAFFEGLLPEGALLESLLRKYKLDKSDYFGQLVKVGHDVVGAVTIEEMT